jgi:protein-arginine kinase activator protein McsA
MAKVFEFKSVGDLKQKVEGKDLSISLEVYNQIKKAFYSKVKRKKVTAFSAKVGSHDIIDFVLERDQWNKSLNTCLDVFIKNEMYEDCATIRDILNELEHEH